MPSGKERQRDSLLRRRYGIGVAEYNRLIADQNGLCAICAKPEKEERFGVLCVDHLHCPISPRVRGLLCTWCNKHLNDGRGEDWSFHEQPDRLQAYADNPPPPGRSFGLHYEEQYLRFWLTEIREGGQVAPLMGWGFGNAWLPEPPLPEYIATSLLEPWDAWYRHWLLTAADYLRRTGWIQVPTRALDPKWEALQAEREARQEARKMEQEARRALDPNLDALKAELEVLQAEREVWKEARKAEQEAQRQAQLAKRREQYAARKERKVEQEARRQARLAKRREQYAARKARQG